MPNPPSVLVVDDEPLIAMMMADWLTELGWKVVGPVSRPAEALSHIGHVPLDAILLDVSLGGDNSFSIAEFARTKNIPVAFVTGRAAHELPAGFREAPLLSKPFQFDDVKNLMSELRKR